MSAPSPPPDSLRSCKRRFWLLGAALGLSAIGLIERGGLRHRVGSVRRMVPESTLVHPASVVVERHNDGEYHYGLLFLVLRHQVQLRLAWYSELDTHLCDRGPIRNWQGRPGYSDDQSLAVVLFLPRSWLILQGFLPLRAGFDRQHPHPLRDQELLLRSFWLEAFGQPRSKSEGQASRK